LCQIYTSAERFLGYSLRSIEGPMVWHIVGHAMRDRRLVNLVRLTCEQIKGEHLFFIADPNPKLALNNIEQGLLKNGGSGMNNNYSFRSHRFLAEEYMARLGHCGLPSFSESKTLLSWFDELIG
jgi:hypothetical protein